MQFTAAAGFSRLPGALNLLRTNCCAVYGRRADAHCSAVRSRTEQDTGRISTALGAAGLPAAVEVGLGPTRIRASLTGAPGKDRAVTSPEHN
jgi:hypothetical protein